jgi:hypothetical protein
LKVFCLLPLLVCKGEKLWNYVVFIWSLTEPWNPFSFKDMGFRVWNKVPWATPKCITRAWNHDHVQNQEFLHAPDSVMFPLFEWSLTPLMPGGGNISSVNWEKEICCYSAELSLDGHMSHLNCAKLCFENLMHLVKTF